MKIDTIEKLNDFVRQEMIKNEIRFHEFRVWQITKKGRLLVDIDSVELPVDFIVFLGNCLKKYKIGMLYTDATLE